MNCKNRELWLMDYLNGDMDTRKKKTVEKHIEECRGCKKEIEETRFILNKCLEIEIPRFSENFWEAQREKIATQRFAGRFNFKIIVSYASLIMLVVISAAYFSRIRTEDEIVRDSSITSIAHYSMDLLPLPEEDLFALSDFFDENDAMLILDMLYRNSDVLSLASY